MRGWMCGNFVGSFGRTYVQSARKYCADSRRQYKKLGWSELYVLYARHRLATLDIAEVWSCILHLEHGHASSLIATAKGGCATLKCVRKCSTCPVYSEQHSTWTRKVRDGVVSLKSVVILVWTIIK